MKHTPTPWTFSEKTLNVIVSEMNPRIIAKLDLHGASWKKEQTANAEFIVRAVNSHEILVKALEKIIKIVEPTKKKSVFNWPLFKNRIVHIAKEALEKVK